MNLIDEVALEELVCSGNLEKNVTLDLWQLISQMDHNPCKRLEITWDMRSSLNHTRHVA
jgi:hypothetical protein